MIILFVMRQFKNPPSPTKKQYLKSLNILFESQPPKSQSTSYKIHEYKIRKNKSPEKMNNLADRRPISHKFS